MKIQLLKVFCMMGTCFLNLYSNSLAEENTIDTQLPVIVSQIRADWRRIRDLNKGSVLLREDPMVNRLKALTQTKDASADIAAYLLDMLALKDDAGFQFDISEGRTRQSCITLLVERIYVQMEIVSATNTEDSRKKRYQYFGLLGKILPVSRWSSYLCKLDDSIGFADIDPPPPTVPQINRETMLNIAAEFERAGKWDIAWRAYAEGIYSGFGAELSFENRGETWLSVAKYWIRAGECAHRADKAELGKSYLLKAAVFGGEADYKKVEEILRKWANEEQTKIQPEPVNQKVRRDALTKVVHLYAQMNAHPRAFQLLDDYPEVFEDVEKLRKEIGEQWIAVVKDSSRAATKVILYGVEVYPNGDPLKVRIPWAFSDEAIRSVKEHLKR